VGYARKGRKYPTPIFKHKISGMVWDLCDKWISFTYFCL